MRRPRRHGLASRALSSCLVALLLSGCSTTRHLSRSEYDAEVAGGKPPKKLALVLTDGTKTEIQWATIDSDTLRALRVEKPRFAADSEVVRTPYAVALDRIAGFEWTKSDATKTTLLVLGLAGVVALGVYLLIANAPTDPVPPVVTTGGSNDGPPIISSCPLVDSWDGTSWQLDSGTFGGAVFAPIARTDVDELVRARPIDGRIALRLRCAAEETDHVDALSVAAVDHPAGTAIAPDSDGRLHLLRPASFVAPSRAEDGRGRDAVELVSREDGRFFESALLGRDPARDADVRDAWTIEFDRPAAGLRGARLVVDARNSGWSATLMGTYVALHGRESAAWYDAMNADPIAAHALEARLASEAFLRVSVWTAGGWEDQGQIRQPGPDVAKRQAHVLDLTRAAGPRVRVRLESAPSFWLVDRIALDPSPDAPLSAQPLALTTATDARGDDALARLRAADGDPLTLETGDSARVEFRDAPPPAAGVERSYVALAHGWYRVHGPTEGEPDRATLALLANDPLGIGRASVARLGHALALLASDAQARR